MSIKLRSTKEGGTCEKKEFHIAGAEKVKERRPTGVLKSGTGKSKESKQRIARQRL